MVLLVYAAICGIVNMEVIPDSLLFAKVRHMPVYVINNALIYLYILFVCVTVSEPAHQQARLGS